LLEDSENSLRLDQDNYKMKLDRKTSMDDATMSLREKLINYENADDDCVIMENDNLVIIVDI
jgi:hypothetical protein